MTASISLVLFDLGGVLCHYDRAARIDRMAVVSGQSAEAVRHAIWDSGLEARADAGLVSDADYLREMGALLGCRVTLDDWLAAGRVSMIPDAEVLRLAKAVSTRRSIAVLTNNCRLLADHIHRLCPEVAEVFGRAVHATATYGAAKPAPEAYLRCLEELGAPPSATLFIDDADSNVDGALRAGLHAHKFVGTDVLERELARRQLI